jgi:hypothetical protein
MVSAAKVASFWLSRARAWHRERAPSREEAPSREQAEAAFLDAVRGGQPGRGSAKSVRWTTPSWLA